MSLQRRTGLNPMSARRRDELAARGVLYPSSTLVTAQAPERKASPRRRPASTGPDQATVDAVLARDGYQCVRCGGACWGERGRDWSVQHRVARGAGGTRRRDANAPQTLILLCGSATTGCHGHVESRRTEAKANGWAVDSNTDPLTVPVVHSLHGVVLLTADGGWTSRRPSTPDPLRVGRGDNAEEAL